MALYRWCTKVSWIWQSFNPENTWTEGQVLTKTNSWYAYCDPQGWGDDWPKVDVLVVAWWGGGWYGWWGWWAVEDCRKFSLWSDTSVAITVWAWWEHNTNWCDSCFWYIIACWWWGGWWSWTVWNNWGNWWWGWGWGSIGCLWWFWKQGYSWWRWWILAWWGWGWAWWPWYIWWLTHCSSSSYNWCPVGWVWWQWYYNCFWSECLYWTWWWGWRWNSWPSFCTNFPWWWCGGLSIGWDATYYWWGWGGSSGSWWSCWWRWCQWIVIVKYKTDWSCWFTTATGWTVTTDWDYTVHTFTSDWTFCITW